MLEMGTDVRTSRAAGSRQELRPEAWSQQQEMIGGIRIKFVRTSSSGNPTEALLSDYMSKIGRVSFQSSSTPGSRIQSSISRCALSFSMA